MMLLGIFASICLLSYATTDADGSFEKLRSDINSHLSVTCPENQIIVTLDVADEVSKNSESTTLDMNKARLCLGFPTGQRDPSSPSLLYNECCGVLNAKEKVIRANISRDNGYCGIDREVTDSALKYGLKAFVTLNGNVVSFNTTCLVVIDQSVSKIHMVVKEQDPSGNALDVPQVKDGSNAVVKLKIDSRLVYSARTALFNSLPVWAYPKSCRFIWRSSETDSGTDVVPLLENGCPSIRGASVASSLFQNKEMSPPSTTSAQKTGPHPSETLIYTQFNNALFPIDSDNAVKRDRFRRGHLECDIVLCRNDRLTAVDNYPMCPSIEPCAEEVPWNAARSAAFTRRAALLASMPSITTRFEHEIVVDVSEFEANALPINRPIMDQSQSFADKLFATEGKKPLHPHRIEIDSRLYCAIIVFAIVCFSLLALVSLYAVKLRIATREASQKVGHCEQNHRMQNNNAQSGSPNSATSLTSERTVLVTCEE